MKVQHVIMPSSRAESWTVLGDGLMPIEPVERFLAYLAAIERSPNTVKAYAHDLKDWFAFLAGPDAGSAEHHCSESSVNRKLAALSTFCEFHARHGAPLSGLLTTMMPGGRGGAQQPSFKPFLHHMTKSIDQRRRVIKLRSTAPQARVLTVGEAQSYLHRTRSDELHPSGSAGTDRNRPAPHSSESRDPLRGHDP